MSHLNGITPIKASSERNRFIQGPAFRYSSTGGTMRYLKKSLKEIFTKWHMLNMILPRIQFLFEF